MVHYTVIMVPRSASLALSVVFDHAHVHCQSILCPIYTSITLSFRDHSVTNALRHSRVTVLCDPAYFWANFSRFFNSFSLGTWSLLSGLCWMMHLPRTTRAYTSGPKLPRISATGARQVTIILVPPSSFLH